MKYLEDIQTEEEVVLNFSTTDSYCEYNLLCDGHFDRKMDISAIIEYTLHRMKENNFTDEEIYANSAMFIPTEEQLTDYSEFMEYIDIDLGYIIGGLLTDIYEVE